MLLAIELTSGYQTIVYVQAVSLLYITVFEHGRDTARYRLHLQSIPRLDASPHI